MKNWKLLSVCIMSFVFVQCSPSAQQLQKVVEENPDIVFAAIKKDPEKFIEVVNEAARSAQGRAQEKAMADEKKKQDEEFSNPKKPQIDDARVLVGPKNAPVTIVEYSEFECPYCSRGATTMKEVMKEYDGKVKKIMKHLPLDFHPKAMPAAKAFEAVRMQGAEKAYKFYQEVFSNQDQLRKDGIEYLKKVARTVGADVKKMETDMEGDAVKKIIEADMAEAREFGITGTPGFLINGVSLKGAYPFSEFKKIIDRHLENK